MTEGPPPAGSTAPRFPETSGLEAELSRLLGSGPSDVAVIERVINADSSTFPSEFVTVTSGRSTRVLFCKHGVDSRDEATAFRRGPTYEGEVFQRFLLSHPSTPSYVGTITWLEGHTTLVVDALISGGRLSRSDDGSGSTYLAVVSALGALHREMDQHAALSAGEWNQYGSEHLSRWATRTEGVLRAGRLGPDVTVDIVHKAVELLSEAPRTLVHGEMYPANVWVDGDRVVFLDWETAGAGAGEMDLASLTVGGWEPELLRQSERIYAQRRWGEAVPDHFGPTLAAAKLYALAFVARHSAASGRRPRSAARAHWIRSEASSASARLAAS